ncbi:hypothetical protein HPP92_007713 [Vanilla planifolia]|uniref:Uncharacterized protein n=1 Tax=Vanilla planifolia TaxID=51239 RepID=A0A835REK5_VANPL|nr:hypothetical protein HPP92_007713 [Vanilla planifolia]
MAAKVKIRSPPLFFLLFILLLFRRIPATSCAGAFVIGDDSPTRRDLLGYVPTAPNCAEIAEMSQCRRHSKLCRWCTSEALDDMCVGSSEAWRLPYQVFSCS